MFSECLPYANLCVRDIIYNFSVNLLFEVDIFIPDLLTRKWKLMKVKWEGFGSLDNVGESPL